MMFDDSARPLYHLCERLNLGRIQSQDYYKYIQKAAKEHWNKQLPAELLNIILNLTRCHPYYVNVLCSRIWRQEQFPTQEQITAIWSDYIKEEQLRIAADIGKLSHYQRLMLMMLALKSINQPTSKEVVAKMRASVGSAAKSLQALLQNDYVYKDDRGYYRILDPSIDAYLQQAANIVMKI